jgi:hypothetical protein
MEITPKKNIIIIDPYLLIPSKNQDYSGRFKNCQTTKFLVCDHLDQRDFTTKEFNCITSIIESDEIEMVPIDAVFISELFYLRTTLTPYQISILAAAQYYDCLFASDCCIFQKQACLVLGEDRVLKGSFVRSALLN